MKDRWYQSLIKACLMSGNARDNEEFFRLIKSCPLLDAHVKTVINQSRFHRNPDGFHKNLTQSGEKARPLNTEKFSNKIRQRSVSYETIYCRSH